MQGAPTSSVTLLQAFNATKSFENHAIIAFLESIGAEFGACSNAYTSADETVRQSALLAVEKQPHAGRPYKLSESSPAPRGMTDSMENTMLSMKLITLCSCHKINCRDSQVYEVLVPTDDDKFLRQTLHIFAQFATEIRCSAEDLAKERGAVLEVGGVLPSLLGE